MNKKSRKIFLTLFYSGLFPKAPGTMGTIVALFLGMIVLTFLNGTTLLLGAVFISIIAIKQIDIYEKEMGEHDSKEIVIDELAGMWIAMYIAGVTAESYILALLAFIFFRLFDILKPWIIGEIDQKVEGGMGVMGDDIVAGFFGGLCALLLYSLLF
ncbi:MAG TPA: phosphatidylglycerophosphatase A [Arcobacter sp.]|nr:phosphatidylglycerophosphatase A [Arcobacter sp.]